jgi:pimeloyl-ACP methyl ester carboxylesterase
VTKINLAEQDIYYTEKGTGETLLIFPDNAHASGAYAREVDYFSDRFRVLSFDYPGVGHSTRDVKYQDEREFDLWNYHADLACHLLQALHIERCYVMGAGYAAWSALHFAGKQAALHQLTVRGVVADSFLGACDGRTLHRALDRREHYYVRRVPWLQRQHGDDWRAVVDADTAFLRRIADQGGYALPDGLLNAIPCPVLLTGNLQDPVTPGIAAEYARLAVRISLCSLYLAAHSGHRYGDQHPLMWTASETFRDVVGLFW